MHVHALGQNWRIVTTLKNTDDPPRRMHFRHVAHDLGQLAEVFHLQSERAYRVGAMTVEPGTDENQLRPKVTGERLQFGCERVTIGLPRCSERHWQINRRSQSRSGAGFVAISGTRIKRPRV